MECIPANHNKFWFLRFSPNNPHLVSNCEKKLKVRETKSGEEVANIAARHTISSLTFSPDGRRMAYGGYFPDVHIWDLPSRSEIAQVGSTEYSVLAFTHAVILENFMSQKRLE